MAFETFAVRSNLTVDEAFARLVDLTRVNEWDRGVSDPQLVHGDGPSLGARYEVTVTGFDGQPTTATYELTEFETPTRFVMIGESDAFRAHDTVTLAPLDDGPGCEVSYAASLELLGDDPPLNESELARLFTKVVAVPRTGLESYLND